MLPTLQPLCPDALKSVCLIATDMDGTLTQHEKFTAALLQTLAQLREAGIPVVIVTGRSAGWVSGLVHYLPVAWAIAENGGFYYPGQPDAVPLPLVDIADLSRHRQQLSQMFARLQADFPQIRESADNLFRLSDWTFDVQGLSLSDLQQMADSCQAQGWGFTYSTVQCHIKLAQQEKANGLKAVLERYFPQFGFDQIVTVGDSPNDTTLFDAEQFFLSVGVANLKHYASQMPHLPRYVTQAAEVEGFCELARAVRRVQGGEDAEIY
jgi:hydroxymethylpyrimidine pyrophosphatase-like HAD family hydrolase